MKACRPHKGTLWRCSKSGPPCFEHSFNNSMPTAYELKDALKKSYINYKSRWIFNPNSALIFSNLITSWLVKITVHGPSHPKAMNNLEWILSTCSSQPYQWTTPLSPCASQYFPGNYTRMIQLENIFLSTNFNEIKKLTLILSGA